MKRAISTLFQPQRWMSKLGQSALAVLFVWCCIGLQTAGAQVQDLGRGGEAKITSNSGCSQYKITACNNDGPSDSDAVNSPKFIDDGLNDGNYADTMSIMRNDTIEFCGEDAWHRVNITFTAFDLEDTIGGMGDTLKVYQSNKAGLTATSVPAGVATGTGVSKAFGGWVAADCDPAVNASGCLTFIFKTDGDNAKGAGWEAWVDCEDRNVNIAAIADVTRKLDCEDRPYDTITVFAPAVTACGVAAGDSVRVVITNQAQDTCIDMKLSATGAGGLPMAIASDTFAIGIYTVRYTLCSDPTKIQTSQITVQAPNLVCNDDIRIPFGSACMIAVTPDMILEEPCDTIQDTMRYNIVIKVNGVQVASGVNPILSRDLIKAQGGNICGGTATVEITRMYLNVWNQGGTTICNNGAQSQTCSTSLFFEDKSDPIFTSSVSGTDTLVACDTTGLAALVQAPTAIDNCDSVVVTSAFTGIPDFSANPCFDTLKGISVVYTATDECGNTSSISRSVIIIRPETNKVTKVADDELECNSDDDSELKPGLAIGAIVNGAFVPRDTLELFDDKYVCGYILDSRDVTVPAPGCGKKVFRYWSVVDWCNPAAPSPVDTQLINYKDTKAPDFADNDHDALDKAQLIDLGPFECSTATIPGAPTASDECAGDVTDNRRVIATEQLVDSAWVAFTGTSYTCDTFRITYAVSDDCPTQPLEDTASTYFIVRDVTPPSAICTDELIVSVGSGAVRITPADLNAGSYDACETLSFKVRIKGTEEWKDEVALTCENKPSVDVELQVTGSKSDPVVCWSKITVEDKIAPVCNQLDNYTKKCTDFHPDQYGETGPLVAGSNLEKFYNDNFDNPFEGCSDNCGEPTVKEHAIVVTKEDCGAITIVRTYGVEDWGGIPSAVDTQIITVTPVHDFKLSFPADQEVRCSDADQTVADAWDLDQILVENNGCDIFALEVSVKEFTVDGDFCKKIERTYEVINWCTYTPGQPAVDLGHDEDGLMHDYVAGENGRYVYTQVIKFSVDVAPEVMIDDVDECINAECSATKTFSASAANCLLQPLTEFRHILRVDGEVVIDNEAGSEFDYVVEPGKEYEVEFWGFDDCGNSDGATRTFTFKDCVRPTPYVLHGIAVELMQTQMVEVWASDLDRGSFDNCADEKDLQFRIRLGLPEDGPAPDADAAEVLALPSVVKFDCDNFTNQAVSFYVIDLDGNWDVVETYILVQDNFNVCGGGDPMGRIAGKVTNAFGENVEAVTVSVNGGDNAMATAANGEFSFNLPLAGDYTITPEKNMNPLNGVSTFDLVLISKHILGLQQFDSPYKYIAADVNKSGSITAFDMVQLRQLILNVTSEFPNNTSWRFVDAKHEFTSDNPAAENFAEFMSINNLDGEMPNVDFIAAKIGDVNGTASANSLLGAEARNINGTLSLNVVDQLVEAGQTVTVDFTSADIATAQGYQFTMDFDGLSLVELNEGVAKAANFNTNLTNRGILTTSWNGEATANDVLFSLTFTANTNGLLSELISVNSDLTVAEAYNTAGDLMSVALDFNSGNTIAAFDLQQNTPNPFNGETVIGFNLPQAGAATLTVMDIQGKVLTTIERDGVKGYNQVTINAKTLGATGVLYYQLESSDNIATKKMIIID